MSDTSILDDVRAAAAEVEAPNDAGTAPPLDKAVDVAAEPAAETAEQTAQRARDEQGRFAKEKGQRPTLSLKEKAPGDGKDPDTLTATAAKPPETAAPATGQALVEPPMHWKGGPKVQFARLPPEVKQGILDDHKALQETQAQFEPLNRALEPYREVFIRDAGSMEAAVSQLGQFYRAYLDNPVGLIQHIARTRGIDLGQSQGQPQPQGAGTPQSAPDLTSLVRQAVQQEFQPIRQQFEQTENQQLQQTVETFARDPAHPYFQDVKAHMGHLLKAGQAKDMQDAYDQATWAHPVIRQQLMESQMAERAKQQAAEADKARKAAAASVRGSPIPGVNGASNPNASVHDEVRQAWRDVMGQ